LLVESRDDAVLFSTDVLDEDLTVDGEVRIQLYVSSDRLDTDFTVRLCDVYPDGRSMLVMDGIRRMRFRESFEEEVLMTPGEVYPVLIEMPHTALTFLAGHRIRLCISSSNYPQFDINLNNGDSLYVQGDTLIASNCLYHDVTHPSVLILPVNDFSGVEEGSNYQLAISNGQLSIHPNPATHNAVVEFVVQHLLTSTICQVVWSGPSHLTI
jgi:putative CocE/NonD family hydrolase